MPVVAASAENIRRAAEILVRGGVVAFPTETVYGLGADALSATACARIFAVKRRPEFDPLIVHVNDFAAVEELTARVPAVVARLATAFWPGPLTLVVPKSDAVPGIVTAGLDTVAIRMPSHPVARALIEAAGRPIAAPSANPFGYISPTRAEHVARQLGDAVELILDGGPCERGIESTILDVSGDLPIILRPGALAREAIEAVTGPVGAAPTAKAAAAPMKAPGLFERHYAPHTPVRVLGGRAPRAPEGSRLGLLAFRTPDPDVARTFAAVETLSSIGDLTEAAASLFASLHALDAAKLEGIWAEPVPPEGLGVAIADRLRRASRRA